MGWISYHNYAKEEKPHSWINSRWIWFIGNGNKTVSLQITSTPHFGWGFEIDGSNGEVSIDFWFGLKFYLNFEMIFPEWIYSKEYKQFADKDEKPNSNRLLKGRKRTKDKGWIRTARRETSLRFHNYSAWWDIWRDPSGWSSDVPRWRSGSLDFKRILKGRDWVVKTVLNKHIDEIQMPEGKYLCVITLLQFDKRYQRWKSEKWHRYELEFGYRDKNDDWVSTPVIHWGKGENSWDCGMDGTYSITLSTEVKTLEEAKKKATENCLRDRERYGSIDFSNISGDAIVNGGVRKNLIQEFEKNRK